jgi:sec-independent protein translocase protein TatB
MFDVGFSEMIVIAVVALIVIGPERLPGVARTLGHLLGRLQRYVSDVKSDINREMQLEELKKMQQDVVDQARNMEKSVSEQLQSVETSLNQSIAPAADDTAQLPPPVADVAVANETTPVTPVEVPVAASQKTV